MNDNIGKDNRSIRNNRPTANYEVGYTKPPKHSQFSKGTSGNPKGRPKGSKNKFSASRMSGLGSIILQEAYRSIAVHGDDKNDMVPMAQAVMRSIAVKAVKGDHRSQRLFQELVGAEETAIKRTNIENFETAIEYVIEAERELERRKQQGIKGPNIIPHPSHIEIDYENETVLVRGPTTKEEKAYLDELRPHKGLLEKMIAKLERQLFDNPTHPNKKELKQSISAMRQGLTTIANIKPV